MTPGDLQGSFVDVLWLGGAPDAGKSTVARILVRRYGLGFYSLDKREQAHLARLAAGADAGSAAAPATYQGVLDTTPVERLAELAPAEHLAWSWTFARDRFPFLLEDLRAFQGLFPILVEGVGLLPNLVTPLLKTARQAIWLVPAEAFAQANWERSKKHFLARQTADPDRARRDLMALDRMLAERIAAEARANGLQVLEIDGLRSPADVAVLVAEHFEPYLPVSG